MKEKTAPVAKAKASAQLATDASSTTSAVLDPEKIEFKRLKRSIRVTQSLLRATRDIRKLIDKLAAPFLEQVKDTDSQKKIAARKNRQRSAVFLAAKDVLDPDHPIKKSLEESLVRAADLDASVGLHAQNIKSKILERLDKIINQAVADANEQKSVEFCERFSGTTRELTGELDLLAQELTTLHAKFKTEYRQAWVEWLSSTRNLIIAAVIMAIVISGLVGYLVVMKKRAHAKALEAAAHAAMKFKKMEKKIEPPPQENSIPSKIVPVVPSPQKKQDITALKPDPAPTKNTHPDAEKNDGDIAISSDQDPESRKKSLTSMQEAIKAWNAESDAQNAHEKGRKK